MYLHIGNDVIIHKKDIIGIFDLENTSIGKITRDFLKSETDKNNVINVTENIPKTFILTKNKKCENLYISQMSTATLTLRMKKDNTGGF